MRIRSSFKDYYDAIIQYGFDSDIVFQRFPSNHQIECRNYSFGYQHRVNFIGFIVGVCGELFLGQQAKANIDGLNYETHFFYDEPSITKFLEKRFSKKERDLYLSKTKYNIFKNPPVLTQKHIKETFQKFGKPEKVDKKSIRFHNIPEPNYKEFFNKSPLFTILPDNFSNTVSVVNYNPRLVDIEFQRVMPADQIYQKIFMWLANSAKPNKPIPEISDEIMAEVKGFDKYSFRKDKNASRRR